MRPRPRFPVAVNVRGRPVGVWLGAAVVATMLAIAAVVVVAAWAAAGALQPWARRVLWIVGGALVVFAAGLADDRSPDRTRGVARQLSMLLRGRVTTGAVKLAVIVAASGSVAWGLGTRGPSLWLGIPVVAGAANLWNLLDVAPGRSLKAFLPAVLPVAILGRGAGFEVVAWAAFTAAALALPLDLRERAMLGDAGSNVLGFVVGIGLLETLAAPGLGVALAAILALHVVSETVTLSRAIAAAAPLRWLDGLGRVRDEPARPAGAP